MEGVEETGQLHGRSPDGGRPESEGTRARARAARESLAALWRGADGGELADLLVGDGRERIAIAARAARQAGIPPEQFLWQVKESWMALPQVRTAADPLQARETLTRIITVCIREFFRDGVR